MGHLSKSKKYWVENVEYISCPICGENKNKKSQFLHPVHVKSHGKTMNDIIKEYPNHPTMTKEEEKRRDENTSKGKEIFLENRKNGKLKECHCFYEDDEDCSKDVKLVDLSDANKYLCDKCFSLGKINLDKRYDESAQKKREKTVQEKYGVKNVQQVKEINEKSVETQRILYGGVGFESDKLAEKTRDTIIDKYGVDNYMKYEGAVEHLGDKVEEKYGNGIRRTAHVPGRNERLSESLKGKESKLKGKTYEEIFGEEIAKKIKYIKSRNAIEEYLPEKEKLLEYLNLEITDEEITRSGNKHNFKCKKCNTIFNQYWYKVQRGYKCPICYPRNTGWSKADQEIYDFIKEDLKINVIKRDKNILDGKELDIYIPDYNLAIEHNGLYYHSEEQGKDCLYHLDKTNKCLENNINLIHIFEDEWEFKKDICKNKIIQYINDKNYNTSDDKYIIEEIKEEYIIEEFLNRYCFFNEYDYDDLIINLGCFYNKNLVSIISFIYDDTSTDKNDIWEIRYFSSKNNENISFIFKEFIEYFKNNFKWNIIYVVDDKRMSEKYIYEKYDFEYIDSLDPICWYFKNDKKRIKFGNNIDWILKEKEGYKRIWDCGYNLYMLINN